jgi:ABC-type uncharacterized transport system auxiliary subunit
VGGCGLFGTSPETRYFTLYAPPPAAAGAARPAAARYPARVAVLDLKVAGEYKDDRLAYRPSPYEIGYYNYARWAAAPEVLVSRAVRERLAAAGLFAAVLPAGSGEPRDLVVDGRIDRLEEIDEPGGFTGRLALDLALREAPDAAPIFAARYEKARPMSERSPAAIARALSDALDEAIRDFLADSERALARRK